MEKVTKQIVIGVTEDGGCAVSVSPDMDATTAFQLTGTLALHLMTAFRQVAVSDIKKSKLKTAEEASAIVGMTESIYDAMDSVFSNVLSKFYPSHPKYSLEDEAILELTNKKIEERYKALSKEERVKYRSSYDKMKHQLEVDRANDRTSKKA